jgi:hypothetical protein
MNFYAQIDADGICFAVSVLSGPVVSSNLIALAAFDENLIGKKWDGAAWLTWDAVSKAWV